VRNDLILINGGYNPVDLYFTHRKGWSMETEEVFRKDTLEKVISKGCHYLFICKKYLTGTTPDLDYPVVYQDDQLIIFTLSKDAR
jgi:hypothetical protein